ncbi:TIGR02147 family protein [Bdellovibrio bacteriovorus]|uniref:TIGR02147 family protein n=1 Tax=Bdellovibrio bacteriovorus TaxID=959 RepID=UPI003AA924C6
MITPRNSEITGGNLSLALFLQESLDARKRKNARYSLRAFARDLGISPGRLSDFISGRRSPGKRLCERMIVALKMSQSEEAKFKHLMSRNKDVSGAQKGAHVLREDEFSLIADWEHFALLMLLGTVGFKSDVKWMADRLQTSELKIQNALERMERLQLIRIKKGKIERMKRKVATTHDIPSSVLRESHRQILEHAAESLQKDDIALRDITSITIPADPAKLAIAKEHIRAFRRKMARVLGTDNKAEVYNLNIQLVPVTRVKK